MLVNRADRRKDWQEEANTSYFIVYSEDIKGWGVHIPSTESVVFSDHVLFDEKIPNRQTDYIREKDEMAVKFAPDEKRLEKYQYLVNTYHIDDKEELLYRVNRVVVRKGVIVAYQSPVTAGMVGVEDKTPIHIADVERMTKGVDSGN